jgi:hypothetical protein
VCRERAGNTKTFQCPYHAWTYNAPSLSMLRRKRPRRSCGAAIRRQHGRPTRTHYHA